MKQCTIQQHTTQIKTHKYTLPKKKQNKYQYTKITQKNIIHQPKTTSKNQNSNPTQQTDKTEGVGRDTGWGST